MVTNISRHSWRHWAQCKQWLVFLNDTEVTRQCYYANTTTGVVRVFETDGDGNILLNPDTWHIERRELHGRVELRRRDR